MASVHEPIAVIGMACRFPGGAETPASYWRVLRSAEPVPLTAISDRGDGRTPLSETNGEADPEGDREGVPASGSGVVGGVRAGRRPDPPAALLDRVDEFDAAFFGLTPTEAAAMDPQHRLLLEVFWEALEHAGQSPDRLAGTNTAVYVGIISPDYLHRQFQADPARLSPYAFTGGMISMAARRLSYLLDLRGHTQAIEAACSSSLLAVHHAVRQLRSGECDLALAGGVNLILLPELTTVLASMDVLSADGRSRTFEAGAEGYGRAEGCGMVVLKRLSDAQADGDNVLAVIRGSAVNQEGRTSGITVPDQRAQAEVIRAALSDAGLDPLDVGYVECHGTGTVVGDPIEVAALGSVIGASRPPDRPLLLGSAKAVVGHAEAAAGIAGLIKTILCVRHGEVPGQPVGELNPALALDAFQAEIPRTVTTWGAPGRTRVAGVSAFGFSGTNVHILVEQPPPEPPRPAEEPDRPAYLLALSANTADALRTLAGRYADHLRAGPAETPAVVCRDVCHTANTGRSHRPWRVAVVAGGSGEPAGELADALADVAAAGTGIRRAGRQGPPRLAFLYSGQGSARVGMGRALFDHEPVFRTAIVECDAAAGRMSGRSLIGHLYPRDTARDDEPLTDTAVAQPALFAVQAALTRLWASVGVVPEAVAGHSLGEYAAACAAGTLSWDDGLSLCVERGRLVSTLPTDEGAMLVVFAPAGEVERLVAAHGGRAEIAAYNGPEETVLSGPADAIGELAEVFGARDIATRPLPITHAFHSRLMEPVLDRFEKLVEQVRFAAPSLPLADNLTGTLADEHGFCDARRWRRHLHEPVRYWDGVRSLLDSGITCFAEIGPGGALTGAGLRAAPDAATWLSTLRREHDDVRHWLTGLGTLHTLGVPVDLSGLDRGRTRRRRVLPTYPFERRRLWLDGLTRATRPAGHQGGGLLGRRLLSPSSDAQFETVLGHATHPFLADTAGLVHVGVYAEIAVACARHLGATGALRLANLSILEALVVDAERTLHTIARVEPSGDTEIRIAALERQNGSGGSWCDHARVAVREARPPGTERHDPARLAETAVEQRAGEHFYAEMRTERGLDLGPRVAIIDHLWRIGEDTMLARLRARPDASFASGFDPGVLDACMQMFNTLVPPSAGLLLLVDLGSLDLAAPSRSHTGPLWAYAEIEHQGEREVRGNVRVLTADGLAVAHARDVVMRRTSAEVLLRLGPSRAETPATAPRREAVLKTIKEMSPDDARTRLAAEVRGILLPIVGITDADLDDDDPLPAIGVDSIMATQLRNALTSEFGVSIPLRSVLDGASVMMLAADLAKALVSGDPEDDDAAWQAGRV